MRRRKGGKYGGKVGGRIEGGFHISRNGQGTRLGGRDRKGVGRGIWIRLVQKSTI